VNSGNATEHLQVIRTLMERSALYRRALAPSMIAAGALGIVTALIGWFVAEDSIICTRSGFLTAWLVTAAAASAAALLFTRRQAIQDKEPFWSPPARRVGWTVLPAFAAAGVVARAGWVVEGNAAQFVAWAVPCIWLALHGCALHAAAGFMTRGIRWLGWIHLVAATAGAIFLPGFLHPLPHHAAIKAAYLFMGVTFGLSHFAYGLRLAWTERHSNRER
jgi:hypothetical protein